MEHLNAFLPFEWDARLFHNIYPLLCCFLLLRMHSIITFFHHLPKNSRNFEQNVNGLIILARPNENVRNKRHVLKGSSKFPTENCAYHLQFFTAILKLSFGRTRHSLLTLLWKLRCFLANSKWPIRTELATRDVCLAFAQTVDREVSPRVNCNQTLFRVPLILSQEPTKRSKEKP